MCDDFFGSQGAGCCFMSWLQGVPRLQLSFLKLELQTHWILGAWLLGPEMLMEKYKLWVWKMVFINRHLYFCQRQMGFYQQLLISVFPVPILRVNKLRNAWGMRTQGQNIFGVELFWDTELFWDPQLLSLSSLNFITPLQNREAKGIPLESVLRSLLAVSSLVLLFLIGNGKVIPNLAS